MRLLQLARKLNIKQQQIISYLEAEGIVLDNDSINKKVPDEFVESIIRHFDPDSLLEPETPVPDETPEESPIFSAPAIEKVEEEVILNEDDDTTDEKVKIEELPKEKESIEVIRVQKVQLAGVKVVGKIELPEKPVVKTSEEEVVRNEEGVVEAPIKNEIKTKKARPDANRKGKPHRKRVAETYEQKLKREEENHLRDIARAQRKLKKKKKNHYLKAVVAQQQVKPKKKSKKQIEAATEKSSEKVVYTNPLQRFWKWLNGYYDE